MRVPSRHARTAPLLTTPVTFRSWCGTGSARGIQPCTSKAQGTLIKGETDAADPLYRGGMLAGKCDNSDDGNPLFCDWGVFQVEYCDFSSFRSDSDSKPSGRWLRGKRIGQAGWRVALDKIWEAHSSANPSATAFDGLIVLMGNSAGAIGIMANADDYKAIMLADSRFGTATRLKLQAHSAPFMTVSAGASSDNFKDLIDGMRDFNDDPDPPSDCTHTGSNAHLCWRSDTLFPLVDLPHDDKMLVFSDQDMWADANVYENAGQVLQQWLQNAAASMNAPAIAAGKRENVLYYTGISHATEDMWVVENAGFQAAQLQAPEPENRYRAIHSPGEVRAGMQLKGMDMSLPEADRGPTTSVPLEEYTYKWVFDHFQDGGYEDCTPDVTSSPVAGDESIVTVGASTWADRVQLPDTDASSLGGSCEPPSPPVPPSPPAPPPSSFFGLWTVDYNPVNGDTPVGTTFYIRYTCDLHYYIYLSESAALSDSRTGESRVYPAGHGFCNAVCEGGTLPDYQHCIRYEFSSGYDWNECFKYENGALTLYSNSGPSTAAADCSNCVLGDDGPTTRPTTTTSVTSDFCSVSDPDMRTASPPPLPPIEAADCQAVDADWVVDFPWNQQNNLAWSKLADPRTGTEEYAFLPIRTHFPSSCRPRTASRRVGLWVCQHLPMVRPGAQGKGRGGVQIQLSERKWNLY